MPLLPDGKFICLNCQTERTIPNSDWILDETDDSVFTSTPCPTCDAQESFCWHNYVYFKVVAEERLLPPEEEGGEVRATMVQWHEDDPEHWDARHMVTIAEVAKKLHRKQRLLDDSELPFKEYSRKPVKHDHEGVREGVRLRGEPLRKRGPQVISKEKVDAAYSLLVEEEEQRAAQKTAHKQLQHEQRADRKEEEELPPDEEITEPAVDGKPAKVSRFSNWERQFGEGEG